MTHRMICLAAASCGLALLLTSAPARAQGQGPQCPPENPASSRERRALAKEWFSRAETAEATGDPIGAVKAYQCSLRLVPHAFTAFNLGRLAERTGDLELAVESFTTYLKLAPEAPDRTEIDAKITGLNERISSLRAEQLPTPPPPAREPGPASAAPLPDLRPPPAEGGGEEPPARASAGGASLTPAVWVVSGVGLSALAGGILLNLGARSDMDECYRLAEEANQLQPAIAKCDAARPKAYASYALFGVAAAAVVADAVLLVLQSRDDPESRAQPAPISLQLLPGGAVVGGRLRF